MQRLTVAAPQSFAASGDLGDDPWREGVRAAPGRQRVLDILFKFDAHSKIALHWHRAPYRTLVLQGELRIYKANGDLIEVRPVGSYVRGKASDEPHTEGGGDQDAIVFFSNREVDDLVYQIIDESGATIVTFGLAEFAGLQKIQEQGCVRGVTIPELEGA